VTENQIVWWLYAFAIATRIPRIVERWRAPLLRGPGWFFNVEAAPDFLEGSGGAILRRYRRRLFLPWAIEVSVCAALLLDGRNLYAMGLIGLIMAVTLLTRLNYIAARRAAENQARRFELPGASHPVSVVALSLHPRTLGDYTNPWIEAAIALALGGSLAWLGYRYAAWPDWQLVRGPFAATVMYIYLQGGVLLIKRAIVRARCVAPADNASQYLAWRDSLRRLATAMCDYVRLVLAFGAVAFDIQSVTNPWAGSAAQRTTTLAVLLAGGLATAYQWRRRVQYLEVARRTRPANFLVLADVQDTGSPVCFRPALPVLLLNGPNGYALNLASAAVKATGLYLAGFATLWVCLTR
jgi:hypothetical protein